MPQEAAEAAQGLNGAENGSYGLSEGLKPWQMATAASAAKRRAQTRCKRGHLLAGDNLVVRSGGRRNCRACTADNSARWNALTLVAMQADREHHLHGTTTGASVGCKCFRCRLARSSYLRNKGAEED